MLSLNGGDGRKCATDVEAVKMMMASMRFLQVRLVWTGANSGTSTGGWHIELD